MQHRYSVKINIDMDIVLSANDSRQAIRQAAIEAKTIIDGSPFFISARSTVCEVAKEYKSESNHDLP